MCRILKQCPGGLYSFYQNGSLRKRKATPENANYQVILPIRAMLLKKQDLKKYKALTALQGEGGDGEDKGGEGERYPYGAAVQDSACVIVIVCLFSS